jgi:hypothetical protein
MRQGLGELDCKLNERAFLVSSNKEPRFTPAFPSFLSSPPPPLIFLPFLLYSLPGLVPVVQYFFKHTGDIKPPLFHVRYRNNYSSNSNALGQCMMEKNGQQQSK